MGVGHRAGVRRAAAPRAAGDRADALPHLAMARPPRGRGGPAMSTPAEIAQASAARMWAADVASRELGMQLDEVRPGYARLSMTVTGSMVQGHGSTHGGFVFTLADSA